MSDREFENYLTLIGRLLRLSTAQRAAIGEELRDHFESRLAELVDHGFSHDQAVKLALEEFGDAAGLAAHFSTIAQTRNRRLIMRCTLASVVVLAAVVLVALAIWPDNHSPKVIDRAVADPNSNPFGPDLTKAVAGNSAKTEVSHKDSSPSGPTPPESPDILDARTEAMLDNEFTDLDNLQGTPLSDLLEFLQDKHRFPMYIDTQGLKDASVDITTMQVVHSPSLYHIRLKTALDLILHEFNLSYFVRDGILVITTKEKADSTVITRVYDCQALLAADNHRLYRTPLNGKQTANAAAVSKSLPEKTGSTPADKQTSESSAKNADGAKSTGDAEKPASPADDLIDLVVTTIAPQTWANQQGAGTIQEYNGLLVVNQTDEVQTRVAELLDQISSKLVARPAK